MSDSDAGSDAWSIAPSQYAKSRPVLFSPPGEPVSLYVAMRDGCRLALDYYLTRPASPEAGAGGEFPVIVLFTPYYRRFSQIGSASCRESVCQYVELSGGGVTIK